MVTLFGRSVMVLTLLFGLLFAVLVAAYTAADLPWWFAILSAVGVVFLQYLLGPYIIQWIYHARWVPAAEVSPRLGRFLEDACRQRNIPAPRFGVIPDGNPNAFTFGHYPGDARLVVTQGLLDVLNDDEREAVVAHELGHIAHWDFVVMTVAAVIPLVLYVVFRLAAEARGGKDDDGKGAAAIALVAAGQLVGKDAVATGWYRREPRPYLELHYVVPRNGATQTCYAYAVKLAIGAVLTGLGILLLLPVLTGLVS